MTKQHITLRCIVHDGVTVGYRAYRRAGFFGALSFVGYFWLPEGE